MKHTSIEYYTLSVTFEPLTWPFKLYLLGVFFFLLVVVPFLLCVAGTLDNCSRRGLSAMQCYQDVRRAWKEKKQ